VEIKEKGRLTVNGGNAQQPASELYDLGGGAGGVIQIISPEGTLAARTLSLKHGDKSGNCYGGTVEDGYFHWPGNTMYTNPYMLPRHTPTTVEQLCHSLTFNTTAHYCALSNSLRSVLRWTRSLNRHVSVFSTLLKVYIAQLLSAFLIPAFISRLFSSFFFIYSSNKKVLQKKQQTVSTQNAAYKP